jgi:Rrf2 family iron-sulfur cluster assembly transcriptional regulator
MKLSTKGRYAVTAILDMTLSGGDEPVNLSDVAQRQGISLAYLEQLFSKLKRGGIVESIRGPGGGYRLVRPPEALSVAEVIEAVGEKIQLSRCGGEANCCESGPCLTHYLWSDLDKQLKQMLQARNFADLAGNYEKQAELDSWQKVTATAGKES